MQTQSSCSANLPGRPVCRVVVSCGYTYVIWSRTPTTGGGRPRRQDAYAPTLSSVYGSLATLHRSPIRRTEPPGKERGARPAGRAPLVDSSRGRRVARRGVRSTAAGAVGAALFLRAVHAPSS